MGYGGRPTKYVTREVAEREGIESTCDIAERYLDGGYVELDQQFPSIAGLSVFSHISRQTLRDWALQDDKKEFSYIIERLRALQEMDLTRGGFDGSYPPVMAKLLLNKHGIHDKVVQDVNANVNNQLSEDEVNAKLKALISRNDLIDNPGS